MNKKLFLRTLSINAIAVLLVTGISILYARKAEYFGDLVFVAMMMYAAGGFFFINLLIAIIQALRKKEWIEHAIMAIGSVFLLAMPFLIIVKS